MLLAGINAKAQSFGLSVAPSANSILVSNSLTYTITVTNLIGTLPDVVVSNTLPASIQLVTATPSSGGVVTNYGSVVVFDLGGFGLGGVAQMTLTVQPTATGSVTNAVVVYADSGAIYTAATNVVTQVTNSTVQADLDVAITVPATAVIVNDWMAYQVSVTNLGPASVPNVFLTNTLPAGVVLKGVSPGNANYTIASSNLIFNLGAMNEGASTNFQISIQPTNADVLNLYAAVGAPAVTDSNPANNTASNSIVITNYLPGILVAGVTSTQIYNPQNGLVEQTITVSNTGPVSVPAARVVVSGLSSQQLFNNVGTNNGNPFVVYASTLAAQQSVNLLLQFFATNYFTLTNSQLQAYAVPVPNLAPPPVSATSTNLLISRIMTLSNGNVLIEFPSIVGRTYTVVYSDNVLFSNAMIAPPSIIAPANRLQWVDYGPPTTISAPTNASVRFYRVILNP